MSRTLIYNARLIDKDTDKKGALLLNGKKIEKILTDGEAKKLTAEIKSGEQKIALVDAEGCAVFPSFIDLHAHFRDPGFTQKEDIESGCKAAVAGGYGCVVLMPNTNPVVSTKDEVQANNQKAKKLGLLKVIQSASITTHFEGQSVNHLKDLNAKETPVITEDGKEVLDSALMLEGMKTAAAKKMIVSCHCEDPFLAQKARPLRKLALEKIAESEKIRNAEKSAGLKKEAATLLTEANTLLELAEDTATLRNIRLAKEAGCHLHLCHVSTKTCILALKQAKAEGMNITAEITPHHIGLIGSKVPNLFQIVNPPLRNETDVNALIEALDDGTADTIATDHAPHTYEDKLNGSPGFSGIETSFAVSYTTLVLGNAFTVKKLSELMSYNASQILGLKNTALLKEGYDANLALVDLEEIWTVKGEDFVSRGKYTPLEGQKIVGKVKATFFEGKKVFG